MPDYTRCPEIWDLFRSKWPAGAERDIELLYALVQRHGLRRGDHDSDAPGSTGARWKRNVRNVLKGHTDRGDLVHVGPGRYWMG